MQAAGMQKKLDILCNVDKLPKTIRYMPSESCILLHGLKWRFLENIGGVKNDLLFSKLHR